MTNDQLNKTRNIFFRQNYSRLFYLLLFMLIINLILTSVLIYLVTHRPAPKYFASSGGDKNTVLYPLTQPVVSQSALLDWATQAAIKVYTYDFLNYQQVLKEVASLFTPEGWKYFQNNLQPNLRNVIEKKLRVTAVATGAPIILEQGPLLGHYAWKVSIPILVTYESASEIVQQPLTVTMVIMRVPTKKTVKGIAIAQFYAKERSLGVR